MAMSPSLMQDCVITHVVGTTGLVLPLQGNTLGPFTKTVKKERHDEAEIQELAAKMVEQQKAALLKQQQQAAQIAATRTGPGGGPLMQGVNGQPNILNFFSRGNGASAAPAGNNNNGRPQTNGQGQHAQNGKSECPSPGSNGEKKTCDEESQKGHFGWTTFGKTHIPYIHRQAEKYCAVRMTEMKLLGKYLNCLHPDIYSSCTCVRSYYITEAESRLLNEINHKHCDAQFGRELFTLKDLVVRLSDATKFYQFLDICYRKLISGSKTPAEKCGFIRINKESVVPYTVRNEQQVVPLFYFEGETENLKQKADNLSGWDLAYLKFCCKVQGIRNELFSSESVAVISLTDIKSYFPNGTEFEDYWPSKVVDSNLLLAQRNTNTNNSINWTRQPSAPPPKILATPTTTISKVPSQHQQQQKQAAAANNRNAGGYPVNNLSVQNQAARMHSASLAAAAVAQQGQITAAVQAWSQQFAQGSMTPMMNAHQLLAAQAQQNQRGYPSNRNQMANLLAANRQYNQYTNGTMGMQQMGLPQNQQTPPPLVRAGNQNQPMLSSIQHQVAQAAQAAQAAAQRLQMHGGGGGAGGGRSNGATSQSNSSNAATMHLQRHAASVQQQQQSPNGATDHHGNPNHRLNIIPEVPGASLHSPPYKVQKVFVDNTTVPCINMKAFNDSEQLIALTDLKEFLFPSASLETCKRSIEALNVEMYKGNRRQIQVLMENGRVPNEHVPLVQVRDVLKLMPQLRFMMRNAEQQQPPSKRSRIS